MKDTKLKNWRETGFILTEVADKVRKESGNPELTDADIAATAGLIYASVVLASDIPPFMREVMKAMPADVSLRAMINRFAASYLGDFIKKGIVDPVAAGIGMDANMLEQLPHDALPTN